MEPAQDASLAQAPVIRPKAQPNTQQRNSGNAPGAAAGVLNPAPTPATVLAKPSSRPPEVGTIAPGTVRVMGAIESRPSPGFPDCKTVGPEAWRPFFAKTKRSVKAVQWHVEYLIDQQQYKHVIALLNAAIIEGQSQPWMYEMLAVMMQKEGYPQDEIERIVLSVADFGNATYDSMMYSGAYLKRFDRYESALRMYRQASRLAPERPEPYSLGMKLAAQTGITDDAIWAACGVLRNNWSVDHQRQHELAENLLSDTVKELQKTKQDAQIAELEQQATEARRRDLQVRMEWNGNADLDLSVQDPAGGIASFQTQESAGGGYLLSDGYGPKNCLEEFVCPVGFSGEYILRVKKESGKLVGERAVLTIVTHAGSPLEKKTIRTVTLDKSNEQMIRITLEDGRREQRRAVLFAAPAGVARDWERVASQVGRPTRRIVNPEVRQAVAEMRHSRQQGVVPAGAFAVGGVVGFAPVVTFIPTGTRLVAQAVVSPDRRYVRMALSPSFTEIVDVAVFSFQGGNAGTTTTTGR